MPGPLVLDRCGRLGCVREDGVKRPVLFDSADTEGFDEVASDVAFLVEFRDDVANRFDAYVGLKESLESPH